MAREILFKAKIIDNGEWVEGFYVYKKYFRITKEGVPKYEGYKHFIHNDMYGFVLIDENTLCQYTGLTDANGNKIWENDVVKTESDLWHGENKKERVTRIGVVIYDKKFCQFGLNIEGFSKCHTLNRWKGDFNEVIGNSFDNPELLGGGE